MLVGTTDEYTNAQPKSYSGFTQTGEIEKKKIAPDGSTVVLIYYDRDRYTITFDANGGSEVESITAKYDASIAAPANPTRAGYRFK